MARLTVRSQLDPGFVVSLPSADALVLKVVEHDGSHAQVDLTPQLLADLGGMATPDPSGEHHYTNGDDDRPVFGYFEWHDDVRFFAAGRRISVANGLERLAAGLVSALKASVAATHASDVGR